MDAVELASRANLLDQLAGLPSVVDHHETHPWRDAKIKDFSFNLRDRLTRALDDLLAILPEYEQGLKSLAAASKLRAPATLSETENIQKILQHYDPALFHLDLEELHRRFTHRYRHIFRSLLPAYQADLHMLRNLRRSTPKLSYSQALKEIQAALQVKQELDGKPTPGDPVADPASLVQRTSALAQKIVDALTLLTEAFDGKLPTLDGRTPAELPFNDLLSWLHQLRSSIGDLRDWAAFLRLREEAAVHELTSFIDSALTRKITAGQWKTAYLRTFYRSLVDAAATGNAALRSFDSHRHQALIDNFRTLDRRHLHLARARIQAMLGQRRPTGEWLSAASAEPAILRREAAKKRRLKPMRRLFSEIPRLITDLKPCLLMSPLTVSMFLDPNLFKFDLVIFDEASQIPPEEAVGAIMRGKQTIIVGDKQQLPPTRFFTALVEDDSDDNVDFEYDVFDSILEECEGVNLPQKMLLWHYRSRHESLIAFSNHHFYRNRLYTFPSMQQSDEGLGLESVHVPDGVYLRGHLRRNDVEARRVVDLILEHYRKFPQQTLGVIAFSLAQQEAIRMEWERRRREQPEFESFFNEDADEPFFIKNLETVQGDERDAIIFSVGYGRDETGKMSLNFGPLNRSGGERRLNVAVTRARCRVKLVSSIVPEEIDLTRTNSNGVRLLRQYMEIARDGLKALHVDLAVDTNAEFESPFEQDVYEALIDKGLTVHKQVGVSGYRIDLAVVDPDLAGSYLLGIECDGATYHSARTARDRDRLRQQVLESLGWRIHRIWSRDWIDDRQRESEKLKNALVVAWRSKHRSHPINSQTPLESSGASAFDAFLAPASTSRRISKLPKAVRPYKRASLQKRGTLGASLNEASLPKLVDDFAQVVTVEGPIHEELVFERICEAWGVKRLGNQIRSTLQKVGRTAERSGMVKRRGAMYWPVSMTTPAVRTPDPNELPRPINLIALEEIAEAALLCLQDARSLVMSDLIKETAGLLGYNRTGAKIEESIREAVNILVDSERIKIEDERLLLIDSPDERSAQA